MQLGVVFYPSKTDNCRTILPTAKQIKMRINIMHSLTIKNNSFDNGGGDVGVQLLRISININVNVELIRWVQSIKMPDDYCKILPSCWHWVLLSLGLVNVSTFSLGWWLHIFQLIQRRWSEAASKPQREGQEQGEDGWRGVFCRCSDNLHSEYLISVSMKIISG